MSSSLNPLAILIGFTIALIFLISGTSTSVFECHPPESMRDDDGIEASCFWSMFRHGFVGPSDTPGEYCLSTVVAEEGHVVIVDVEAKRIPNGDNGNFVVEFNSNSTTGTNETSSSPTSTSSPPPTTNATVTTAFTNDTGTSEEENTTTTTTNTTTTQTTWDDNVTTSTTEDNATTGSSATTSTATTEPPTSTSAKPLPPVRYISVDVPLDEMTCKPLAARLRAMGAFSILSCVACGIGLFFAVLLFVGLEHCGTRCHNSLITMVMAVVCLVLTVTSWSIGSNAYLTKFEGTPITTTTREGRRAVNVVRENWDIRGINGISSSDSSGSVDTDRVVVAVGEVPTDEDRTAAPPLTIPTGDGNDDKDNTPRRSVPSCPPYSLKGSPFNVVYASGWALPFITTFLLGIVIFFSYKADRSGSSSSGGYAAGDLGQPIWPAGAAAPQPYAHTQYPPPAATQGYYQPLPHPSPATTASVPPPSHQHATSIDALLLAEQQRQAKARTANKPSHPSADYSLQ